MPETQSMPTQGHAATAGPDLANILCAISGKEGSVGVGHRALGGFSTALLVARPLEVERPIGDRIVVASDGLDASRPLIDLAARIARAPSSSVTLVHALGRESPIKRDRPREQERT